MQLNLDKGNASIDEVNKGIDSMKAHVATIVTEFNAYKQAFDNILKTEVTKISTFTKNLEAFVEEEHK